MFNFFQPPFALDFSDNSIEIIALKGSLDKPRLLAMSRTTLDPDIIEDGKIINKEKLKKILLTLITNPQFGKIKTKNFIFSLPESKIFLYVFKLPQNLKREEKIQKIKSEISQTFPFLLEDLYYDFVIHPDGEILLVAAPKSIVNDYLDLFKACKIKPLVLEAESQSLARSLAEGEKGIILITDIGARTTNFNLFEEGRLKVSVSIPVAGNKFSQKIAEKLKIPLAEAENLKIRNGLNPEIEGGRTFLILQEEIRQIIEEIKKLEEYFQEKTGREIEKIILAGGSAQLLSLPEYLADNLGKKVEIGDPWIKIDINILRKKEHLKDALKINPILYATSVGLALMGLAKDPKTAGINLVKDVKY